MVYEIDQSQSTTAQDIGWFLRAHWYPVLGRHSNFSPTTSYRG